MRKHIFLPLVALLALEPGVASCRRQSQLREIRDLETVNDEYDYIIVGGGTSGLVVANRLTEDPQTSVLVVEYGDFANTVNVTVPYFTTGDQTSRFYDMPSVPLAHLDNRSVKLRIGNVVGGSSTVNGMAWDRGSSIDYDSWEDLGNSGWGWDVLLKYFRKSSRFSPPSQEYVKQYGFEWSPDAYGNGPIHVGYPSWQWPESALQERVWIEDLHANDLTDGADGKNVGIAWLPQSSDGKEAVRSCAETAYYDPVSNRTNLDLLVRHYGAAIKFEGNVTTGVQIASRDRDEVKTISSANVIMAAGTVNTPRILQLSGVGPAKLLESLDIDVVVDAPGVGANFQDHPTFSVVYEFQNDTAVNPNLMQNPEFYDAAWDEYVANKTGPFSHSWGNHVVFESLQALDPDYQSIADELGDKNSLKHLPDVYAENPALVNGYLHQIRVLQSQYRNSNAGVVEITFGGATVIPVALQKPTSRGTITINSTNPDPSVPPLINFNTIANPVDLHILIKGLEKTRTFMGSNSVAQLKPIEMTPGQNVTSYAEIEKMMRQSLLKPSLDHPVGTAAMMPRELGGVVDTQLRVYGIEGLWVVDASIMPLLPAAHTQATVYAVAEYAAEIIRGY